MPTRETKKASASRRPRPPQRTTIGHRPTAAEIAAAELFLEPWQLLTAPKFYGVEHVPAKRPFLLVGNHTLMGVLDVPLMVLGLYDRRGVMVRSLGDHLHFRIPLWRDLLTRFGTVDGTRENCEALMRAGESVLVFPGGGREVFKHKGEQYHLIWKNRIGFAALAMKHGYPIVPCVTPVLASSSAGRMVSGKVTWATPSFSASTSHAVARGDRAPHPV